MEVIFQEWGQIASATHVPLICNTYQKKLVTIYTYKVLEIDETIKTRIQGKGYWPRIKESHSFFENKGSRRDDIHSQNLQKHKSGSSSKSLGNTQEEYRSPISSPGKEKSVEDIVNIDNLSQSKGKDDTEEEETTTVIREFDQ